MKFILKYLTKRCISLNDHVKLVKLGESFLTGSVITNRDRFITNWGSYYKQGQFLWVGTQQRELEAKPLFKSFGKLSEKNSGLETLDFLDYNLWHCSKIWTSNLNIAWNFSKSGFRQRCFAEGVLFFRYFPENFLWLNLCLFINFLSKVIFDFA